jgi:hypothetical protein
MRATIAVANLLKAEPEYRQFFKRSCLTSGYRLASQGWQFRDELADRGQWFELDEVEDALLDLARKLLPDTPGAKWSTKWADKLCQDAFSCLQEHYAGLAEEERETIDLSAQESFEAQMVAAGEDNDPAEFRRALKRWRLEGMAALHEARHSETGAA